MGQAGKYASHTTLSLLKLKTKFHNSKLESIDKDADEWISNLEGLRIQMHEFGLKGNITDKDFMIQVLNNLPMEYNVILDGLKNHLTASGNNMLTVEIIHEKLNHWYKKIKSKDDEKREKEKALGAYNKQYKHWCHTYGMVTNLVIVSVGRIKKEHQKMKKKTEKNYYEKKSFNGVCYHCFKKGHISRNCKVQKKEEKEK